MKRSSTLLAFAALGLLSIVPVNSPSQRKPVAKKATATARPKLFECTKRFTTADWLTLLGSVNKTNTELVNRLFTDAEVRKGQIDNMSELLAISCEAVNKGIAEKEPHRSELKFIDLQIRAAEYDRFKFPALDRTPFENVTAAQISAFYKIVANEKGFADFLATKVALIELDNPEAAGRPVTDEERTQARDQFARMSIVAAEQKLRSTAELTRHIALTIKLQQAQFLARSYEQQFGDSFAVTDAEIAEYVAGRPELSVEGKRVRANDILRRALAGEDFAALADEFSDDPGNRDGDKKNGGAYTNVPKGQMVAEFEKAALAVEAGKVNPALAETRFGFHVVKLDRVGDRMDPDMTYDVRHILISTMVSDPDDSEAGEMPVAEFVKSRLENEKRTKNTERILAAFPIEIAAIPTAFPPKAKSAATPVKPKR